MTRLGKGKKGYALYDKYVRAEDKYRVKTLPQIQFRTRAAAKRYLRKHKMEGFAKILVVYGLPARFVDA
jgi:hypothetical protein